MSRQPKQVLIVGAGYAGLAAAITLSEFGVHSTLCERQGAIGGLSRTIELDGVRFELGPHIYFDKDPEVNAFWNSLPGVVMEKYERKNRIYFEGKFIKSPLSIPDTLVKLGPRFVSRILWSYLTRKVNSREIESAEDWVKANFGGELFNAFFKVYNEKIWGIPSSEMAADWAGQRIKASLSTMVVRSLVRDKDFIVKTFNFPRGGSRSVYQAQLKILEESCFNELLLREEPASIQKFKDGFEVTFRNANNRKRFSHIIWTGHLDSLFDTLTDNGAIDFKKIREIVSRLKYRNLVLLNFVFKDDDIRSFREHWIDVHDPDVRALRVTNFSNYDTGRTDGRCGVGVEYNCWPEDDTWKFPDCQLRELGIKELQQMKLLSPSSVPLAFSAIRLARAYPVYFKGYKDATSSTHESLRQFPNLITTGRNGLYKWNNMHHSVKTGILAAKNVLGANFDLLTVKGMVSIGKDFD